jgi:CheY-like chemotaxis protein
MIAKNVLLEAHLIDDLLDLTRIARGKLVLDRQPVAIHEILQDAITNVHGEVAEKQLSLEIKLGQQNPLVHGDPVRLQQVFWNVLKNAAKFTPRGGRISVATRVLPADDKLVVEITDTGAGMTAAEISRIFEAFAQGDHASTGSPHRFGGLGLGLAISRSLVELHAGTIQAESAGIGQGSTFTIELPIASVQNSNAPLNPTTRRPGQNQAPIPGLRILLVEDHAPTRLVLAHLLKARNYVVATAGSISEGRALGMSEEFDLLVTDIGLPDGNGYELMEELGQHRNLRGVALTGYGAEQDVIRAQKAGFVAHLTKPVSIRTLDGVLENVMKTAGKTSSG